MSKFDLAGEGTPGARVKEHTLVANTPDAREYRLDTNYPIGGLDLEKLKDIEGVDSINREGKYCFQIHVGALFEVQPVVDKIEARLKSMELPTPAKEEENEKEEKPKKRPRTPIIPELPDPHDVFDGPIGNPNPTPPLTPWVQPGIRDQPWHPWRGTGQDPRARWNTGGVVPSSAAGGMDTDYRDSEAADLERARENVRRVFGSNADDRMRTLRGLGPSDPASARVQENLWQINRARAGIDEPQSLEDEQRQHRGMLNPYPAADEEQSGSGT